MTDSSEAVGASNSSSTTPTTATTSTPQTQAAAATSQTGAGANGAGTAQSASTMEELRQVAPEVYNVMMQGIAMRICNDMRDHQNRLKKLMRKARDNQA